MVTWTRIAGVATAIVFTAVTTAYASDKNNGSDKNGSDKSPGRDNGKPRQVVITSASVDRVNDRVVLRGQNFGDSSPTVYCEIFPLVLLDSSDTELVAWFPGAVPQGTYLFTVVRGRGNSELERNVFYVTVPPVESAEQRASGAARARRARRRSRTCWSGWRDRVCWSGRTCGTGWPRRGYRASGACWSNWTCRSEG